MKHSLKKNLNFCYLGIDKFDHRDRVQVFNHNGSAVRTNIVLTGNGISVVLFKSKNEENWGIFCNCCVFISFVKMNILKKLVPLKCEKRLPTKSCFCFCFLPRLLLAFFTIIPISNQLLI